MSEIDTIEPDSARQDAGAFHALGTARRAGKRGLHLFLALQTLRTALRVGFSASAALAVGRLVMDQSVDPGIAVAAIALLASASLAGIAADRIQASAETGVSIAVRDAAANRLNGMPARTLQSLPVGTLIIAMQRHPESLAALVVGHRAATMMMAIGPMLAAAMLVVVSWQAALLVMGLTPIMIVFFALVGDAIRRRADAQERAFGRLAGQFADRIRTLPTILANHALAAEEAKLSKRLDAYAQNTMGVLRIAFVNAGIIDFFASLSIAMLAVFLGLGHLKLAMIPGFSNLELWQSLFILMIAPEYFAPFRRYSEQYHAKAEGMAAADSLDRLLGTETVALPDLAALDRVDAFPETGLVAILGPSGSGKSTLLRRIAGLEPGFSGRCAMLAGIHWIASDSYVPEGTLGSAVSWNAGAVDPVRLAGAAASVGLLDDALLPGGLDARLQEGGANLSGGQRLRISVARAALNGRAVLADEPTAKLDRETADAVRKALLDMARSRLVVVATHDRQLAAAATMTIDLSIRQTGEMAA